MHTIVKCIQHFISIAYSNIEDCFELVNFMKQQNYDTKLIYQFEQITQNNVNYFFKYPDNNFN